MLMEASVVLDLKVDWQLRQVRLRFNKAGWAIQVEGACQSWFVWAVADKLSAWIQSAHAYDCLVLSNDLNGGNEEGDSALFVGLFPESVFWGYQGADASLGISGFWGGMISRGDLGVLVASVIDQSRQWGVDVEIAAVGTEIVPTSVSEHFSSPVEEERSRRPPSFTARSETLRVNVDGYDAAMMVGGDVTGWGLTVLDESEAFFSWATYDRLISWLAVARPFAFRAFPDATKIDEGGVCALFVALLKNEAVLFGYEGIDGIWSGVISKNELARIVRVLG